MNRIKCKECENKDCGNSGTGLTVAACSGFQKHKSITNYDRYLSKTNSDEKCNKCKAKRLCSELEDMGYLRTCKTQKPLINADRIRAMSDEELAEWICDRAGCPKTFSGLPDCISNCRQCWHDWLKQEAKE